VTLDVDQYWSGNAEKELQELITLPEFIPATSKKLIGTHKPTRQQVALA